MAPSAASAGTRPAPALLVAESTPSTFRKRRRSCFMALLLEPDGFGTRRGSPHTVGLSTGEGGLAYPPFPGVNQ